MQVLCLFVVILARVLNIAILARVLLSWLSLGRDNQFAVLVHEITEPILGPIRRAVPSFGGLDISPILGLFLVGILRNFLLAILPC